MKFRSNLRFCAIREQNSCYSVVAARGEANDPSSDRCGGGGGNSSAAHSACRQFKLQRRRLFGGAAICRALPRNRPSEFCSGSEADRRKRKGSRPGQAAAKGTFSTRGVRITS